MLLLALLLAVPWPGPDSLQDLALPKAAAGRTRVVIDAGHGAPGNDGNHGCHCQLEREVTLDAADRLAAALRRLGRFAVFRTRVGKARPEYRARIRAAEAFAPAAVISLHTDVRGEAAWWSPDGVQQCLTSEAAPGFSVLWSDDGPPDVVRARERLGRALGRRLREAGFIAYRGDDYDGLYRRDTDEPGGWIDVHQPGSRIFFLHASELPTVIIELHHALDPREVARWKEPQTHHAFARAVAAALLDLRGGK